MSLMGSSLTVLDLPDEVLIKIFSFCSYRDLSRLASVCKHWLQLCGDRSLFKNVVLANELHLDEIKIILYLMLSSNNNRVFSLKIMNRIDSLVILNLLTEFLSVHKRFFTQYSFSFEKCCCCLLTNEQINAGIDKQDVVSSSLNLNALKIRSSCNDVVSLLLEFFYRNIFGDIDEFICGSLEKIDISCTSPFTSCINNSFLCFCLQLKELVKHCKNLVVFKFKNNLHRKFYYTIPSCNDSMNVIFQGLCTHNFRLSVIKIPAQGLFDKDISLLKDLCHLKVLHLFAARRLSSNSLSIIMLFNLSSFLLTENIIISPQSWVEYIENSNMSLIKTLCFDECLVDNSVMFAVGGKCKNLKKLTLNGCRNDSCELTSEGLITVFNSCHKLEKISLRFVDKELEVALGILSKNVKKIDFIPIN